MGSFVHVVFHVKSAAPPVYWTTTLSYPGCDPTLEELGKAWPAAVGKPSDCDPSASQSVGATGEADARGEAGEADDAADGPGVDAADGLDDREAPEACAEATAPGFAFCLPPSASSEADEHAEPARTRAAHAAPRRAFIGEPP